LVFDVEGLSIMLLNIDVLMRESGTISSLNRMIASITMSGY